MEDGLIGKMLKGGGKLGLQNFAQFFKSIFIKTYILASKTFLTACIMPLSKNCKLSVFRAYCMEHCFQESSFQKNVQESSFFQENVQESSFQENVQEI